MQDVWRKTIHKQNHISNQMYLNAVLILLAHFLFRAPDILLFCAGWLTVHIIEEDSRN